MIVSDFIAIFEKISHHNAHQNPNQSRSKEYKNRKNENISPRLEVSVNHWYWCRNKGFQFSLEVRRKVEEEVKYYWFAFSDYNSYYREFLIIEKLVFSLVEAS